jgi:hypothetical protein
MHTSTSKTWHLQAPHARTSERGIEQDLHKSPFTQESTMKMLQIQSLRTPEHGNLPKISQNDFTREVAGKMPGPRC